MSRRGHDRRRPRRARLDVRPRGRSAGRHDNRRRRLAGVAPKTLSPFAFPKVAPPAFTCVRTSSPLALPPSPAFTFVDTVIRRCLRNLLTRRPVETCRPAMLWQSVAPSGPASSPSPVACVGVVGALLGLERSDGHARRALGVREVTESQSILATRVGLSRVSRVLNGATRDYRACFCQHTSRRPGRRARALPRQACRI